MENASNEMYDVPNVKMVTLGFVNNNGMAEIKAFDIINGNGQINIDKYMPESYTLVTTDHENIHNVKAKKPYLVFRGTIKDLSGIKSFSESVQLDYMGSSEFEWGAPTYSRLRMAYYYRHGKYRKHRIDSMKDTKDNVLRIYHRFSDEQVVEYAKFLREYINGKIRFKEWTDFDAVSKGTSRWDGKFDFWWDIENDCYFSYNKMAINKMPTMCEETIKRMESSIKV